MRGATIEKDSTKALSNVIRINDERIQERLGKIVRGSLAVTPTSSKMRTIGGSAFNPWADTRG